MSLKNFTTTNAHLKETAMEHPVVSKSIKEIQQTIEKIKLSAYSVVKGEEPEGKVTRAWLTKFARRIVEQSRYALQKLEVLPEQWEREISIDNEQVAKLMQEKNSGEALSQLLYIYANLEFLCSCGSEENDLRWVLFHMVSEIRHRKEKNACHHSKTCTLEGFRGCRFKAAQVLPFARLQIVKKGQSPEPLA